MRLPKTECECGRPLGYDAKGKPLRVANEKVCERCKSITNMLRTGEKGEQERRREELRRQADFVGNPNELCIWSAWDLEAAI